jgi:hypothetical protein
MVDLLKQKFNPKKNQNDIDPENNAINSELKKRNDFNIPVVIAVIIAFIVMVVFFYLKFTNFAFFKKSEPVVKELIIKEEPTNISTSSSSFLPNSKNQSDFDYYDLGTSTEGLRAEDLSFGMFYQKSQSDFKANLETYILPLNTKTDIENYFKVNRTFNIDSLLDDLNNYGFAIFDSKKITKADDFYETFHFLAEKEVPIIFTSDFSLYYYQSVLKEVYKEIEKTVFYENLWDMSKSLYNISLIRYKNKYSQLGDVNDALLEGERLNLAFWTLALKLLEPTEDQISKQNNLSETSRFSEQELDYFHVSMPIFLEKEINEEIASIRGGQGIKKSSILTFERDYRDFQIPNTYKTSPKLINFYLATRWLNTLFPLYEQSITCPDCLLDKDDNLINLIASGLIAQDISKNQEIKNNWAAIYKFISFFRGLSQGYTFLNYNDAFRKAFGDDYDLEKIFEIDSVEREESIIKIKNILEDVEFLEIDGADSYVKKDISLVGMKILQDDYWPNDYIFGQFIGSDMQFNGESDKPKELITFCSDKNFSNMYRCRAFGLDIINLIYPINDGNEYFSLNTAYSNYGQKINNFSKVFDKFNEHTWNNNIYWTTLDYLKSFLPARGINNPRYMQSLKWQNEKNYKTALGAWVNMHLEEDILESYFDQEKNSKVSLMPSCDPLNYVEPDPDLYRELIARSDMLIRMMYALEINKQTNSAIGALKELNEELRKLLEISEKELSGKFISEDDCDFIYDLIGRNFVSKKSAKSFNIKMENLKLSQSIEGIDILSIIYLRDGKKYLAFGPIFNYEEGK